MYTRVQIDMSSIMMETFKTIRKILLTTLGNYWNTSFSHISLLEYRQQCCPDWSSCMPVKSVPSADGTI